MRRLPYLPAMTLTTSSSYGRELVAAFPVRAQVVHQEREFGRIAGGDERQGLVVRHLQHVEIAQGVGDVEAGFAVLPGAKEFARAAEAQVHLRDFEAVVGA